MVIPCSKVQTFTLLLIISFASLFAVKKVMEAVRHSIRELTPNVTNVKTFGYTFVIVFHDMASTVLRMKGGRGSGYLVLSPQVLVDARCNDIQTAIAFATQQELGLEDITQYPYIQKLKDKVWSERSYASPREERYRLDDVKVFANETEIVSAILANFGAGGPKFPFVGILKRNDFTDREAARVVATGRPFRFPENAPPANDQPGSRSRQAVLIVGVDTTPEDPMMHFCEVKGCHGKRWGVDGFSQVGFEVFDRLLVPVMND